MTSKLTRQQNHERLVGLYPEMVRLTENGWSKKDIAKRMNCTPWTVGKYLRNGPPEWNKTNATKQLQIKKVKDPVAYLEHKAPDFSNDVYA